MNSCTECGGAVAEDWHAYCQTCWQQTRDWGAPAHPKPSAPATVIRLAARGLILEHEREHRPAA